MKLAALREFAIQLLDTELEGNRNSMGYRKIIRRNTRYFFSWLEEEGIEDIGMAGKTEVFAYYRHVCAEKSVSGTGEPISSATINWRLLAVRKLFASLYRLGYIATDPMQGLELGVQPERCFKRRPFTEDEISFILEQIDPSTPLGLRDRALFELIYSSGLRVCEASRLTMGDLDLERREIVLHGKGSRDRLVPISALARDFLRLYAGERINHVEEPVFRGSRAWVADKPMPPEGITQRFHDLLDKFGMYGPGRSTHAVRHSTATHMLDHGASIRHIQELLGHKNIDTTVRYTEVQTGALARIYRKYHPGEHELFEVVDDAYEKRLDKLISLKKRGQCIKNC